MSSEKLGREFFFQVELKVCYRNLNGAASSSAAQRMMAPANLYDAIPEPRPFLIIMIGAQCEAPHFRHALKMQFDDDEFDFGNGETLTEADKVSASSAAANLI